MLQNHFWTSCTSSNIKKSGLRRSGEQRYSCKNIVIGMLINKIKFGRDIYA
ncbi:transposase-like zinc-binding domain-containing protein [Parendozoicomonas callyspongiae]